MVTRQRLGRNNGGQQAAEKEANKNGKQQYRLLYAVLVFRLPKWLAGDWVLSWLVVCTAQNFSTNIVCGVDLCKLDFDRVQN